MNNEWEMEEQLWAYIDGLAGDEERAAIERHLAEHESWRAKYAELLQTHQLLLQSELEEPSLRFTRNVLEAIAGEQVLPAARQYLNRKVIGGIAALFLLLIGAVLVYALAQAGTGSGAGSNFPKFDFSLDGQSLRVFGMVNILLALFLLDRVLSARRRGAGSH